MYISYVAYLHNLVKMTILPSLFPTPLCNQKPAEPTGESFFSLHAELKTCVYQLEGTYVHRFEKRTVPSLVTPHPRSVIKACRTIYSVSDSTKNLSDFDRRGYFPLHIVGAMTAQPSSSIGTYVHPRLVQHHHHPGLSCEYPDPSQLNSRKMFERGRLSSAGLGEPCSRRRTVGHRGILPSAVAGEHVSTPPNTIDLWIWSVCTTSAVIENT